MTLRIGFDMDGVLTDFTSAFHDVDVISGLRGDAADALRLDYHVDDQRRRARPMRVLRRLEMKMTANSAPTCQRAAR